MTRKMNQPSTILKNIMNDCSWPSEALVRTTWSDEKILADLADFAEQMWHNQYIEVDVSKVTPDAFRKAAVRQQLYLKELWAGAPEEFM
jgi:hypothetical protein